MKFEISIPSTVNEAHALDLANTNYFWVKSLQTELKYIIIVFKLLEHDKSIPVGSKHINYHFIFDVKFDLTQKARYVAGGHRNKDMPAQYTYASIVSIYSVRI